MDLKHSIIIELHCSVSSAHMRGSREGGGQGVRTPGKSQVKWVSIGNKQLDPTHSPGKSWTASGTLEMYSYF